MAEAVTLDKPLTLHVDLEEESETGRWIADVTDIPGVMAYGATPFEALAKVKVLAIEVVGDRLAHGEDLLTGSELGEARPSYDAERPGHPNYVWAFHDGEEIGPSDAGSDRQEDRSQARGPITGVAGTRPVLTPELSRCLAATFSLPRLFRLRMRRP